MKTDKKVNRFNLALDDGETAVLDNLSTQLNRRRTDILRDALSRYGRADRWISTANQLPDKSSEFLIHIRGGVFRVAHFHSSLNRWEPHYADADITHWFSLPLNPTVLIDSE